MCPIIDCAIDSTDLTKQSKRILHWWICCLIKRDLWDFLSVWLFIPSKKPFIGGVSIGYIGGWYGELIRCVTKKLMFPGDYYWCVTKKTAGGSEMWGVTVADSGAQDVKPKKKRFWKTKPQSMNQIENVKEDLIGNHGERKGHSDAREELEHQHNPKTQVGHTGKRSKGPMR